MHEDRRKDELILDWDMNARGLEQLFVICIGFDAQITGRASSHVDWLVHGGWLETTFQLADAKSEMKAAALKIVEDSWRSTCSIRSWFTSRSGHQRTWYICPWSKQQKSLRNKEELLRKGLRWLKCGQFLFGTPTTTSSTPRLWNSDWIRGLMTPKLKLMKLQLRNTHTSLTRPASMTWRQSVVSSAATESAWTSSGPISPGERRGCGRPERLHRCLSAAFCSSLALESSGEHKLLLAVHITDKDGRTPLAEARNHQQKDCQDFIGFQFGFWIRSQTCPLIVNYRKSISCSDQRDAARGSVDGLDQKWVLAQKTYLACFSTWAAEAMQLFLPTLEGMVVPVSDTSRWTKACDTGTEWDRPGRKFDSLVPLRFKTFALPLPSSKLFFYVHCSLCLSDWHTQTFIRCHKMPQCHSMSYHVILVPCHTCTYLLVNQQICISAPFNHFPSLFGMAMDGSSATGFGWKSLRPWTIAPRHAGAGQVH